MQAKKRQSRARGEQGVGSWCVEGLLRPTETPLEGWNGLDGLDGQGLGAGVAVVEGGVVNQVGQQPGAKGEEIIGQRVTVGHDVALEHSKQGHEVIAVHFLGDFGVIGVVFAADGPAGDAFRILSERIVGTNRKESEDEQAIYTPDSCLCAGGLLPDCPRHERQRQPRDDDRGLA